MGQASTRHVERHVYVIWYLPFRREAERHSDVMWNAMKMTSPKMVFDIITWSDDIYHLNAMRMTSPKMAIRK